MGPSSKEGPRLERFVLLGMISTDEGVFLRQALASGIRLDGRSAQEEREVELILSRSEKSAVAEVVMGRTRVVSVTRGEIVSPYADRPNEGSIQFTASGSFKSADKSGSGLGGVSDIELSRMLDRAIRESDAIDTESLCIVGGEKVWAIVCSVTVLDHQGNLTDACTLAAMASLRCFRKPEVTLSRGMVELNEDGSGAMGNGVNSKNKSNNGPPLSSSSSSTTVGAGGALALGKTIVHVHPFDEREPLPLALHHTPLFVSQVAYLGLEPPVHTDGTPAPKKTVLLMDPTDAEERGCDTRISFCFNAHGDLCSIMKPGQAGLPAELVLTASRVASTRADALHSLLTDALNTHENEASRAKDLRLLRVRQQRQSASVSAPALFVHCAGASGGTQGGGRSPPPAPAMAIDDKLLDFNILHEAATLRVDE